MNTSAKQNLSENNLNKAISLSNLANYQDGTVVSRTLIDKATGTVTLFAFAQGQGLSEHTAPFDAFVYIIDGEAEITIEGKPQTVKAGETITMPANKPHALKANKPFKMMLVMIRA
jgi:quercetin dioxygenase-like cupin family protein